MLSAAFFSTHLDRVINITPNWSEARQHSSFTVDLPQRHAERRPCYLDQVLFHRNISKYIKFSQEWGLQRGHSSALSQLRHSIEWLRQEIHFPTQRWGVCKSTAISMCHSNQASHSELCFPSPLQREPRCAYFMWHNSALQPGLCPTQQCCLHD